MWDRRWGIVALVVVQMGLAGMAAAALSVVDGPIRSPVNGHFYSVVANSDWTTAQATAVSMGGNLATIRSAAEETWIEQTFSAYPYLWIGLYDPVQSGDFGNHAGHFVWVSGEPVTYTNWAVNEPNDFDGEEYWTQLVLMAGSTVPQDFWNDMYNDANPVHPPNSYGPDFGLVEVVPEPTGVGMVMAAAGAMLMRRARGKDGRHAR